MQLEFSVAAKVLIGFIAFLKTGLCLNKSPCNCCVVDELFFTSCEFYNFFYIFGTNLGMPLALVGAYADNTK